MNSYEARNWLLEALSEFSGEPEAEARWMLQAVLPPFYRGAITQDALDTLRGFVHERKQGRPLQYILGEWDFMGLAFTLREGVLIPRPETETLVEIALRRASELGLASALDMGTGSGCIAVALAKLGRFHRVAAVDISEAALNIAAGNAKRHDVEIMFLRGEWFGPVAELAESRFDLIVSNPPYIPAAEIPSLSQEVQAEPESALDGGEDGLEAYRAICAGLREHLNEKGVVLFEVGHDQASAVSALLAAQGLETLAHRDLAGIQRVVEGRRG